MILVNIFRKRRKTNTVKKRTVHYDLNLRHRADQNAFLDLIQKDRCMFAAFSLRQDDDVNMISSEVDWIPDSPDVIIKWFDTEKPIRLSIVFTEPAGREKFFDEISSATYAFT